jgi:hypothetical protein
MRIVHAIGQELKRCEILSKMKAHHHKRCDAAQRLQPI